ncbi:MAG TPA: class I SAM-dependent methyltransferase [Chitinophagaceae bacterium]
MKLYTHKYGENVGGASGYAGFRNRRRLSLFAKLIPVAPDDVVLEIGPNTCLLLDAFKEKTRSVVGIDINEEMVSRMKRPDLLSMDAAHMTFGDGHFHMVIGIEVFEHIPDLESVFSEIARVLVKGGKCYLTVPFELFRGQQALGDAWQAYRDLRMARQLHVHKLNPRKIKMMIALTGLEMISSRLIWIPGPSYFMVLEKSCK